MTLPDYQTASGCTDILMHTMERYFTSGDHMELTDAMAEALMRMVIKYATILRDDPQNYSARAEILWAGSLSHNGLTGCGIEKSDFSTHGLEHELGGLYDVAHGAGLAAVWGSWARYVYQNCLHRFHRFAIEVMGVEDFGEPENIALAGIEALEDFSVRSGCRHLLRNWALRLQRRSLSSWRENVPSHQVGKRGQRKNSTKRIC